MKGTTIEFWRIGAQAGTSGKPALQAHKDRGVLLHGMEQAIGVKVLDWGATDDEQPHEIVEVVTVLTPIVVPALATLIKLWLDSRRLEKVRVKRHDGTTIEVGSGTPKQVESLLQSAIRVVAPGTSGTKVRTARPTQRRPTRQAGRRV